jgi:hypothetical protein
MLVINDILVEWPGARVCEGELFDPVKPDVGEYGFDPPVLPTKGEVEVWINKIESDRERYWEFYLSYARRVRGWAINERGVDATKATRVNHQAGKKSFQSETGQVSALRKSA